jgi:hypothetical protein
MSFILGPALEYLPHYTRLWFSHGPGCGSTNSAVFGAENSRGAAGAAIAQAATALAENLRTSRDMYAATDEEQRDALAQQMQF